MTRGVRLYLVGSFVLVSLAGCGRGFFQAEREPWRAEAEIACLKSGAVKETSDLVRISPISGPGVCGADFPLKVAALGESSSSFGFADESLRPPADIGNQPRWPVRPAPPPSYQPPPPSQVPPQNYPQAAYPAAPPRPPVYGQPPSGPISLAAPGAPTEQDEIDLPPDGAPGSYPPLQAGPGYGAQPYPQRERYPAPAAPRSYEGPASAQPLPLGPAR